MQANKLKFDFVNRFLLWLALSGVVIVCGLVSIAFRDLNWAIDFTGGSKLRYELPQKVEPSEIAGLLDNLEINHDAVQILDEAGKTYFQVRIEAVGAPGETDPAKIEKLKEKSEALEGKVLYLKTDLFLKYGNPPADRTVHNVKITPEHLGEILEAAGLTADDAKIKGANSNEIVLSEGLDEAKRKEVVRDLYAAFGGYKQFESEMNVHPAFGAELKKRAGWALLMASICILLYVTVRFQFWFAVAGIIALIHDCLVTVGFFSLLQLEVNVTSVAVLLTVFGYSINDTIVIFDRIRENMVRDRRVALDEVINKSLWETMARSINTVLTTEITVLLLMLFGGENIHDFTLALLIGITAGAYSSIFIAGPLAYVFLRKKEKERSASLGMSGAAAVAAKKPAAPKKKEGWETAPVSASAPGAAKAGAAAAESASAGADDSPKKPADDKKKGKRARRR